MRGEGANPPVVCLGFDIHYPCHLNPGFRPDMVKGKRNPKDSYFNPDMKEDLGQIIDRSFRPATEILLDLLDDGFKCAFSISGVVVEHLERWYPDLELITRAATHRNAEILAETYYHSVAGQFADLGEFTDELLMHRDLMKEQFATVPTTFVHTDYPITPATADVLAGAGIEAAIIEGGAPPAPERDPNHPYTYHGLPVLVTHSDLTDDIAVRFPSREWDRWPLMADRYAEWLAVSPGDCITLFLDYRIFGDVIGPETGIFDFLRALPAALAGEGIMTLHPSEAVRTIPPQADIEETGGPQRTILQQSALEAREAGDLVTDRAVWRCLRDRPYPEDGHALALVRKILHAVSHQATYDYFTSFYADPLPRRRAVCVPHGHRRPPSRSGASPDKAFSLLVIRQTGRVCRPQPAGTCQHARFYSRRRHPVPM